MCGNGIFSILMEEGELDGMLQTMSSIKPTITHLLYADDVMNFFSATIDNATYIRIRYLISSKTHWG